MPTAQHARRTPLTGSRRFAAVLVAAGTAAAAALVTTQPAAADAPWLSVSDGFVSLTIPAGSIQKAMGNVSGVVVEGDFGPAYNRSELGLSKSGDNWTMVIGPLPPGLYSYRFVGDDTKVVKDPTNPTTVTSQPTLSTFLVPGDSARLLADVPNGRGGAVETITYPGASPDRQRSALVWTPPGYQAQRAEPYPVLYLQHGEGGGPADWVELGRAKQILDNLSVQGRITPMVVVMGDGTVPDFTRELLENLAPAVRARYAVASDPDRQAVAGLSAGGSQALSAAFSHPGAFGYVGSFSGLLSGIDATVNAKEFNERTKLLRLYTANPTGPAYNPGYQLMRALDAAGVSYQFDGVNPNAGHTWKAWQEDLADFLPRLFGTASDPGPGAGRVPLTAEFKLPAAGTTPTPWLAQDGGGNTYATFETGAEFANARHVTLWGNWAPGGSWVNIPMTRAGNRWRLTVGPLKPWFYHYKFIVDLASKKDTSNPTRVASEATWSTFLVAGEAARLLTDVPAGKGGAVDTLTYTSTVAGGQRSAYVWTPPGYDPRRATPYPVLYLQHGSGQNFTDWVEMGRARQILDNQFLDGRLVPMVVVMGNGNVTDFTRELLQNIVPAARARYRISSDPAQQALAGLSMGGFQTADVLRTNPGTFAYVGTFSSGVFNWSGFNAAAINRGTRLLRVYTGNVTDFANSATMSMMANFDTLGIKYEFAGVTPGPHGWDTWQKNLIDFAPRLFRNAG